MEVTHVPGCKSLEGLCSKADCVLVAYDVSTKLMKGILQKSSTYLATIDDMVIICKRIQGLG